MKIHLLTYTYIHLQRNVLDITMIIFVITLENDNLYFLGKKAFETLSTNKVKQIYCTNISSSYLTSTVSPDKSVCESL